ncbi:MAG: glycosyltransferase family 2 protein, partial [Blastochloris sp.]|nr:glycosyltransferase family 2 protein [Blastochloris sp.]
MNRHANPDYPFQFQMQDKPSSRFLIPVHNPGNTLRILLEHLTSLPDIALSEVIVIDDGSADGTKEMLIRDFPEVTRLGADGSLFWTGSMALGMQYCLDHQVPIIFWLNHDCRPLPGAAEKLRQAILSDASVGCAAGWCRIAGYPEWPVNPGVLRNRDVGSLEPGEIQQVEGVNGNFVAFRAEAVRKVGLPDSRHFPHYGDGPYTLNIGRSGFTVVVVADARADLDYEVERRLPPKWRIALSRDSLWKW